ncbi:MAG: adenylate/guanylate cyclase domain-containing protein [Gammaproteobacteria bacterium]|nr:adenylate/guanylate cyclase domain-containing protein [Gammaproteobacteria bacterium]
MYKKIVVFIIGVLATAIFLLFTWDSISRHFGVLTRVNHLFYDANLKIFHKKNISDYIIIVDIDEKSLQHEGRWPWSRNKVATMVENLQSDGAAVIVFDILFPEVEPNIDDILLNHARQSKEASSDVIDYLSKQLLFFNNDQVFANALNKSDSVLGVFFNDGLYNSTGKLGKPILSLAKIKDLVVLHESKFIGNIPVLADAVRYTGFTTTIPDDDGTIRRSPLLIEYDGDLYPSLPLEAVRAYLLTDKISLDLRDLVASKIFLGLTIGGTYIPTDLAGNILINYRGPAFSFPYVSATDVFNNKFPPKTFEGKIALIGSSAVGIGDLHSTPYQDIGYPGVEVHANIISSILNQDIISSPLWLVGVERILIVIVGLVITILAAYFPALVLILFSIALMILMFAFNGFLLVKWNLILPHLMLPYLQILFLGLINSGFGYLFESKSRKRLHDVYGQYVSSTYIDKMLESNDKHTMAGNTKVMTVLFADIKSFTSISEKLEAKEVKKFLNTLFTPITEIIFESKGTIDKYVGDMVMAFWNDPIDDKDHAFHCVEAALKMQNKVKDLAPIFAAQNLNDVAIRIGINTGMMHVGDMGSEYRKAYTVLGDAVNLASRLEGVNKVYGTKVLVSEETKDMCSNIVFRFVDCIYVKGKAAPTNIYEPLCLLSQKTDTLDIELAQYQKALDLYNADKWCEAKEVFEKLVEAYSGVELYNIYLKRVSQYETSPPAVNWDRGQHLTQK